MEINETSPAESEEFFGRLSFRSIKVDEPDCNFDVSVWSCSHNICEMRGNECDTIAGIYYGSAEDPVTKFCPRHFYELHNGTNAAYRLVDEAPSCPSTQFREIAANKSSQAEKTCYQCRRPAAPGDGRCRSCILEVEASEAFWAVIVRHYPEAKYRDLSPERTIRQTVANVDAIEEWISNNVHSEDEGNA